MSLIIKIGRRVPRSWFRKGINTVQNVLSFQEHLWSIVKQSMNLAKKKANASNTGIKFVMTQDRESEDLNYEIQWIIVTITGTKEQEEEEYNEALAMYKPFAKIFKKDMPVDERLKKVFKSKLVSNEKILQAYQKGFGEVGDDNISNKLLEMGIITMIDWIKDYETRDTA